MLPSRLFVPVLVLSGAMVLGAPATAFAGNPGSARASSSTTPSRNSSGWSNSRGTALTGTEGSVRVGSYNVFVGRKTEAVQRPSSNSSMAQRTTSRTWGIVKAPTTGKDFGNVSGGHGVMFSTWRSSWTNGSGGVGRSNAFRGRTAVAGSHTKSAQTAVSPKESK